MRRKATKEVYHAPTHDPIIRKVFEDGLGLQNVAPALKLIQRELQRWRRDNPGLDLLLCELHEKSVSDMLIEYNNEIKSGKFASVQKEILSAIHNYYLDQTYINIRDLGEGVSIHKRHDIILSLVSAGSISLEISEKLSKLLKDNADIYHMTEIEIRMQSIETALKDMLAKDEL